MTSLATAALEVAVTPINDQGRLVSLGGWEPRVRMMNLALGRTFGGSCRSQSTNRSIACLMRFIGLPLVVGSILLWPVQDANAAWAPVDTSTPAVGTVSGGVNCNYPSVSAGNYIGLYVYAGIGDVTFNTPSGFSIAYMTAGFEGWFHKLASGSESGTVAVSTAGGSAAEIGCIMVSYSGAPGSLTGIIDASTHNGPNSTNNLLCGNLTPSDDNMMALCAGVKYNDPALDTFAPPTSWTERYDAVPSTSVYHMLAGEWVQTTATELDNAHRTWVEDSGPNANSWFSATLILVPGVAGGEFDTSPDCAAADETEYDCPGSLDVAGDVDGVLCFAGQTTPTVEQIQAGDCTGDVAAEAIDSDSPASGNFDFTLTLTPANCTGGSQPCPRYDAHFTDGTSVVSDTDEYLDPPSGQQFTELASIGAGGIADVGTLGYDAQTANFILGDTITDETSGAVAIILEDSDGGTDGTLTIQHVSGTFGDNNVISGDLAGSADVDGSYTVSYEAGDVLVFPTVVSPDNCALTIPDTGLASYVGCAGSQTALDGLIYDQSAETYIADQDLYLNNPAPTCSAPETFAYPIDEAIADIEIGNDPLAKCRDPEDETLTCGKYSGTEPTGITRSSCTLSGTPTVEDESGAALIYTVHDLASAPAVQQLLIPVIDTLPMVDCITSETAASGCEALAQNTFFNTLNIADFSYLSSDTIAVGNVISQDPAAAAETALGATLTLTVSSGPSGRSGLGLGLRLGL